ncbi:MAG: hypothetical protein ACRY3E_02350 [Candidatus Lariskella arthropodorum]
MTENNIYIEDDNFTEEKRYDSYFDLFYSSLYRKWDGARENLQILRDAKDIENSYGYYGSLHAQYDILTLYRVLYYVYQLDYSDGGLPITSLDKLEEELMFFPPNYSILLLKNKKREINEKSDKYELFLKEFVSEIAKRALEKQAFVLSQYIEDINYEYESSYFLEYTLLAESIRARCDELPEEGEEEIKTHCIYTSDFEDLDKIPVLTFGKCNIKSRKDIVT